MEPLPYFKVRTEKLAKSGVWVVEGLLDVEALKSITCPVCKSVRDVGDYAIPNEGNRASDFYNLMLRDIPKDGVPVVLCMVRPRLTCPSCSSIFILQSPVYQTKGVAQDFVGRYKAKLTTRLRDWVLAHKGTVEEISAESGLRETTVHRILGRRPSGQTRVSVVKAPRKVLLYTVDYILKNFTVDDPVQDVVEELLVTGVVRLYEYKRKTRCCFDIDNL